MATLRIVLIKTAKIGGRVLKISANLRSVMGGTEYKHDLKLARFPAYKKS